MRSLAENRNLLQKTKHLRCNEWSTKSCGTGSQSRARGGGVRSWFRSGQSRQHSLKSYISPPEHPCGCHLPIRAGSVVAGEAGSRSLSSASNMNLSIGSSSVQTGGDVGCIHWQGSLNESLSDCGCHPSINGHRLTLAGWHLHFECGKVHIGAPQSSSMGPSLWEVDIRRSWVSAISAPLESSQNTSLR